MNMAEERLVIPGLAGPSRHAAVASESEAATVPEVRG
jgi:hypothetical protein